MNRDKLKKNLPTVANYLEKRRKAKENQLPKHLRPLPRWPIDIQLVLNSGIFFTLAWLMWNRDEFLSEATPALGMVVCLLLLIYTLISAIQLREQYRGTPYAKRTLWNLRLMIIAGLMFPASVAFFLP